MKRRSSALTAAALALLPLGQPLLLGTLGITTATTAVVLQAPPVVAQDASAVAKVAKAITVRIEGATQGSGVLVKKEGNRYTVLTAWHVVEDNNPGEELAIFTPDGKEHQLEQGSIQRLGEVDMAVLTFSSAGAYEVVPIGDFKKVAMLESIYVAGFPIPTSAVPLKDIRIVPGQVIGKPKDSLPDGYQLLYSNPTLKGMSGGAVLNINGQLVGIHGKAEQDDHITEITGKAIATRTNMAVPITHYREVNFSRPSISTAPDQPQVTPPSTAIMQSKKLPSGRYADVVGGEDYFIVLQDEAIVNAQWCPNCHDPAVLSDHLSKHKILSVNREKGTLLVKTPWDQRMAFCQVANAPHCNSCGRGRDYLGCDYFKGWIPRKY